MMWDYNIPVQAFNGAELSAKVLSCSLSNSEETQLLDILKSAPEMAEELKLAPDKIPLLVENYPTVALELLVAVETQPNKAE